MKVRDSFIKLREMRIVRGNTFLVLALLAWPSICPSDSADPKGGYKKRKDVWLDFGVGHLEDKAFIEFSGLLMRYGLFSCENMHSFLLMSGKTKVELAKMAESCDFSHNKFMQNAPIYQLTLTKSLPMDQAMKLASKAFKDSFFRRNKRKPQVVKGKERLTRFTTTKAKQGRVLAGGKRRDHIRDKEKERTNSKKASFMSNVDITRIETRKEEHKVEFPDPVSDAQGQVEAVLAAYSQFIARVRNENFFFTAFPVNVSTKNKIVLSLKIRKIPGLNHRYLQMFVLRAPTLPLLSELKNKLVIDKFSHLITDPELRKAFMEYEFIVDSVSKVENYFTQYLFDFVLFRSSISHDFICVKLIDKNFQVYYAYIYDDFRIEEGQIIYKSYVSIVNEYMLEEFFKFEGDCEKIQLPFLSFSPFRFKGEWTSECVALGENPLMKSSFNFIFRNQSDGLEMVENIKLSFFKKDSFYGFILRSSSFNFTPRNYNPLIKDFEKACQIIRVLLINNLKLDDVQPFSQILRQGDQIIVTCLTIKVEDKLVPYMMFFPYYDNDDI